MKQLALGLSGALVAITLLMTVSVDAQQQKKKEPPVAGEQCRSTCEADLRRRKLWDKTPYGTCRRQCGMPV